MMILPTGTQEDPRRRRFPFVTVSLVVINVAVFAYELLLLMGAGPRALDAFVTAFGVVPAAVTTGRAIVLPPYLTIFTSMFVHASLVHIGSNMLFLLPFGDNVEDRLGHIPYLWFYLLAGVAAALAQIAVDPGSTIPSVGASGAIAGVLAAYIFFFPRGVVRAFLLIWFFFTITWIPALLFIGFWFVIQFFAGLGSLGADTQQIGGVAYWAHIGGFTAGLAMALLSRVVIDQSQRSRV